MSKLPLNIPEGVKVSKVITYGEVKLITLHVYQWYGEGDPPGMLTYCGLRSRLVADGEHFVAEEDLFGNGPIRGDEVMCPACAATQRYQEKLAWYTLGELP